MEHEYFDINAFRAKPLPTEDEIMANWQGDINEPLVSVLCATYNHDVYIEDTLRGFLLQQTNFPFEIIINDDCSTDDTLDILKKYKSLYPKLFNIVEHDRNMFSLGARPINFTLPMAKGQYICLCEGDDFWFKDWKLSYHVDFLRQKNGISLHVTDTLELDVSGRLISNSKLKRLKIEQREYSQQEMLSKFILLPLTSCFKKELISPFPSFYSKSMNGDRLLQYELSKIGPAYVDSVVTSCHLHHSKGVWSQQNEHTKLYEILHTKLVLIRAQANDEGRVQITTEGLAEIALYIVKQVGVVPFLKFIAKHCCKVLTRKKL